MDRVTAPKLPFDIPRGEQSLASGKGRFCARVRPQSQRGSGEKGFLAWTERHDRGFGALQLSTASSYRNQRSRVRVADDGIQVFEGEARFGGNLLSADPRLLRYLARGGQ